DARATSGRMPVPRCRRRSAPQLRELDRKAGQRGGTEDIVISPGRVGAVHTVVENEAFERPLEGVENPVAGDAELRIPLSLCAAVVGFMTRADGFDDQRWRNQNSSSLGVGSTGGFDRCRLTRLIGDCQKRRV